MTSDPETLFVPSHNLYGRRGLIRPPDNPELIKGAARHSTRNCRWWADSAEESMARMDSWSEFAGLREISPAECAQWAKEW